MQKYLATFGAMALGAVIMFGFTHSEVQAGSGPEPFVCSGFGTAWHDGKEVPIRTIRHCRVGKLDCGYLTGLKENTLSCVNSGGIFK
jgi:hypothetical protein